MSEGYLEPVVATAVFDVAAFLDGAKRAVGATSELTGSLDKAGISAAKTEVAISQAALKASASQDKATAAAARYAKAQSDAVAAGIRAASGEISLADATEKANTAQAAGTRAAQAQAKAALDAQRAVILQSEANTRLAETAGIATRAQADAAAATVGLAAKSTEASVALAGSAGVVGKAATTLKDNWVLAAGIIGFESVKLAGTFQQQTNVLVTAAGESSKNLGMIRDGILGIAEQTGTAWQQVTAGVYVAEKAGYRGQAALDVVKASAEGAREEQANLATVLNATTSVMASYGLKASDAVRVTNEIKTAAGEAKTTMELFAGSLSTVLPIASAAHISFADVAGDLATLTQHGTSADEGTQELANTIRNLQAALGPARKEMAQFGIDSVDVSANLGSDKRGLTGTIDYLTQTILGKLGPSGLVLLNTFNQSQQAAKAAQTELDALPPAAQKLAQGFEDGTVSVAAFRKESRALPGEQAVLAQQFFTTYSNAKGFQDVLKQGGPAAQTYVQALKTMLGGATGLNTALQLTGPNLDATKERTDKIAAAAQGAGKDVSGWASTQKLFNVQLDEFKQRLEAAGIHIGNDLIPPLKDVLGVLNAHPVILQAIAAGLGLLIVRWTALKALGLAEWISGVTTKLLGLGAATETVAGAEGLGGVAGAAAGAETGVAGLGAAFASGGLLVGGAAVVGVGALALSIHELFSDTVKGLPSLQGLAKLIASGGLTGKPATAAIGSSLANVSSGDNRGENQQQYLQRVLGSDQAKAAGLSYANLTKTIQTGTRPAMDSLVASLRSVEFELGGSPATIQKVDDYLTALFDRYNSARVASDGLKASARQQEIQHFSTAAAALLLSTDVGQLAKSYGVSTQASKDLAFENKLYGDTLNADKSYLTEYSKTLDTSTFAGRQNVSVIKDAVTATTNHAAAVFRLTGNQKDASLALQAGITTLENNAVAVGYNRGQVDTLVQSLLGVKANSNLNISIVANGTFTLQDLFSVGGPNASVSPITGQLVAGALPGQAGGGILRGPGTGTSDSILGVDPRGIPIARVSTGEMVVNKKSTDKHRALLMAINADGLAAGGLASFDSAFVPTINAHIDRLENAMNAEGQQWFGKRRTADQAKLTAIGGGTGAFGGSVSSPANEALANAMMAQHGWNARQISEVDAIWTQESGFNANAVNPDGGAYGIPQAYPPAWGHPYALGDAPAQIAWGINYIDGIGGPDAAYARKAATGTYAGGGVIGGDGAFLSAMATIGGATRRENTRLAYNQANIGRAGRANVPGLEAEAHDAAQVAAFITGILGSHKAALTRAMHTGTPAQRRGATAVYNELTADSVQAGRAAAGEATLARTLRARYAGQEAAPLSFGRPTRDLSYLATAGAPMVGGPSHINLTVVSQIDKNVVARTTSKVFLKQEKRGLSNGTTRIRNTG